MRWCVVALLFAACLPSGEAALDAPPAGTPDASKASDAPRQPDAPRHPDGAPPIDAPPPVDAPPPPACDTVTDRTIASGDVVTTCLGSDADVDVYHFTTPATATTGGTLRMKVEFTDCQLGFGMWIDADPQYGWIHSNETSTITNIALLDHHLIAMVAPAGSDSGQIVNAYT